MTIWNNQFCLKKEVIKYHTKCCWQDRMRSKRQLVVWPLVAPPRKPLISFTREVLEEFCDEARLDCIDRYTKEWGGWEKECRDLWKGFLWTGAEIQFGSRKRSEELRGEISLRISRIKSGLSPYILNTKERYRDERNRKKSCIKISSPFNFIYHVLFPLFSPSVKPNLFLLRVWHQLSLLCKLCWACYFSQKYFKLVSFTVK